nr:non-structural polyprotein [Rubivirus strelense]
MERLVEEQISPGGPANTRVTAWTRDKVNDVLNQAWEVRECMSAEGRRAVQVVIPRPVFLGTRVSDHPALHAIARYMTHNWVEWGEPDARHCLVNPSPTMLRLAQRRNQAYVILWTLRDARTLAKVEVEYSAHRAELRAACYGRGSYTVVTDPALLPRCERVVVHEPLRVSPSLVDRVLRYTGARVAVCATMWPAALARHDYERWDDLELEWRVERRCPLACTRACSGVMHNAPLAGAHPGRVYPCGALQWLCANHVGNFAWSVVKSAGHHAMLRGVRSGLGYDMTVRAVAPERVRLPDLLHLAECGRWRWVHVPRHVFNRMLGYAKQLSPDAFYSERVYKFKNALTHSITLAGNLLQEGWKGTCAEEDALCAYVALRAWGANKRLANIMVDAKRTGGTELCVAGWLTWLWDAIKRWFGSTPLTERMESWEAAACIERRRCSGSGLVYEPPGPRGPPPRLDVRVRTDAPLEVRTHGPCPCQPPAPSADIQFAPPAAAPAVPDSDDALIPAWLFAPQRPLRTRAWDFAALRAAAEVAPPSQPAAQRWPGFLRAGARGRCGLSTAPISVFPARAEWVSDNPGEVGCDAAGHYARICWPYERAWGQGGPNALLTALRPLQTLARHTAGAGFDGCHIAVPVPASDAGPRLAAARLLWALEELHVPAVVCVHPSSSPRADWLAPLPPPGGVLFEDCTARGAAGARGNLPGAAVEHAAETQSGLPHSGPAGVPTAAPKSPPAPPPPPSSTRRPDRETGPSAQATAPAADTPPRAGAEPAPPLPAPDARRSYAEVVRDGPTRPCTARGDDEHRDGAPEAAALAAAAPATAPARVRAPHSESAAAAPEAYCRGCDECDRAWHAHDAGFVDLYTARDRGALEWAVSTPTVVVYGPPELARFFGHHHYSVRGPVPVHGQAAWRREGWQRFDFRPCATPDEARAIFEAHGYPPVVRTRGTEADPESCWIRAAAALAAYARAGGAFRGAGCGPCALGARLSEAWSPADFGDLQDELGHGPGDPADVLGRLTCPCSGLALGRLAGHDPRWGVEFGPARSRRRRVLEVWAVPDGGAPAGHFVLRTAGAPPPRAGTLHLQLTAPRVAGGAARAPAGDPASVGNAGNPGDRELRWAQAYWDDLELRRLGEDRLAAAALRSCPRPADPVRAPEVWDMCAGAGKTTRILEEFTANCLYICPTNALLHEFQGKLRARGADVKQAATYERALTKPLATYETIYIDEAFTLGAEYCSLVAAVSGTRVVCVGDRDQCGPHSSNNCRTPIPADWPTARSRHSWRLPERWCARLRDGLGYDVQGEPREFQCAPWRAEQVDLHLAFTRESVRRLAERGMHALTCREAQGYSVRRACLHVSRDAEDIALAMVRDLAIVGLTRASDALYLDELEDGALRAAGLDAFLDGQAILELKEVGHTCDRLAVVEAHAPPVPPADGIPDAQDLAPFCPLALQLLVFGQTQNPLYGDLNRVRESARPVRYMRVALHLLNARHNAESDEEAVLSAVCAVRRYRASEDGSTLRTAVARQHPRPLRAIPCPRVRGAIAREWRATYLRRDYDLGDVYTAMAVSCRELVDRYARRNPNIFAGMCGAQATTVPAFLKATLKCVDSALGPRGDPAAGAQFKAGLEIRAWAKDWVVAMSPHFRAIQGILLRALREEFCIAAGRTEAELDAWWQAYYSPHAVEVDFTEFDMNQSLATRDVELEISASLLGLPSAEDYRALRSGSYCLIRDVAHTETGCERTSGEPATLLHNTLVATVMAMRMCSRCRGWAGVFQGDDMVLFFRDPGDRDALRWDCAELDLPGFAIPIKRVATATPSFCGQLGSHAGLFVDVLHLAVKLLCRRVDPALETERQEAMLDKMKRVYGALPDTLAVNATYYGYAPSTVWLIVRELTAYARARGVDHPWVQQCREMISAPYSRLNLHDAD